MYRYMHAIGAPTVLVRDGGITKAILKGMQLPLVQYYYCTTLYAIQPKDHEALLC